MKFAEPRPYADPEVAARKLIELANSVEAVQDGRIHIELINGPMLFELKATPAEYTAGLKLAIERGWLVMAEARMANHIPGVLERGAGMKKVIEIVLPRSRDARAPTVRRQSWPVAHRAHR